jgi:hypothetical protein
MDDLVAQLAELEAKAAAVRRQIAQGPCVQYGHTWKLLGGRNVACSEDCSCSVSVYVCEKCGDCDYGDNAERDEIVMECAERYGQN